MRARRTSRLRSVEFGLSRLGPTSAYECLNQVPVDRLESRYGIGEGTVDVLKRHGYLSASDLHNEIIETGDLTRILGIGTARAQAVLDWADEEWENCLRRAAQNCEIRFELETRRDELLVELGHEPRGRENGPAEEDDIVESFGWSGDQSPEEFLERIHRDYETNDDEAP